MSNNPLLSGEAPLVYLDEALRSKADIGHTHEGGEGGPHSHEIDEVTGLQAALDSKEADGAADAAVADHAAELDPHPAYLTTAEGDALFEPLGEVAAHEGASDPHPAYLKVAEADLLYEPIGEVAAHLADPDPHALYLTSAEGAAAFEAIGAVAAHVALANPHNQYAPKASPTFTGTVAGITATMVGLGNVDNTADSAKPVSTAQQTALNLKANLASPTFTGTVAGITATMVGLGNVTNTSDANKPVSTAQQAALDLKSNLASPTFTGTPAAPAPAAGTNTTQLATTAYAMAAAPNSSYRTLLDSSGSHIAARVAGTYGLGQGDPIAVTGTGTLYPLNTIAIAAADFPTVNGLTTKLRIRCNINCNDVAPFTGTFVIGLHPVTRPSTSGGAGLCIYTIGAAVAGSTVTGTNLAADSANLLVGADFAIPSDGQYVIGVVTNQTMAASSHAHISASLQMRNT